MSNGRIIREQGRNPRCMACAKEYEEDDELLQLPCRHTIHNSRECLKRFTPFRCMYQCPESGADKNITPDKCRPFRFWTGKNLRFDANRKWFTPESDPFGVDVQPHRNFTVSYARESGTVKMNGAVNQVPSFSAPSMKIHEHKPRTKVTSRVRHRKALIAPAAERFISLRAKMFDCHVVLGFAQWVLESSPMQRIDLCRFKSDFIGSLELKRDVWLEFMRRRNWWFIPNVILSDRSVARDDMDCLWLCAMDRDYKLKRISEVPQFLKFCGLHRWWNGFRFLLDSVKEAFWRNETGRWISSDDTSWRYLSTAEVELHFPLVHSSIEALRIPPALAIPVPPTPYYYGARMARLQRENPESIELKILDKATYGETLIMVLSRYHSEMTHGGRLHVLPEATIDELEKRTSTWDLNLGMFPSDLIKAMRFARTIPSVSYNVISYELPLWATHEMEPSKFTWSLIPFAEVDPHARTGLRLRQKLTSQTTKFVLTEVRRMPKKYPSIMRRLLHRVEFKTLDCLTEFVDEEFGPRCDMVTIGRAFERLVVRAASEVSDV